MKLDLTTAIYWVGWLQLSILCASALVPFRLDWRNVLSTAPPLIRQLFWIYGGYIVISITSLGLLCVFNAQELASGTRLARSVCAYGAIFWGMRLVMQPFLAVRPYLTTWWLRLGFRWLGVLFVTFTLIFGWGVIH